MKKVLIITYYWPPAGGSGVQRWLKFVKYFRNFNIEPIVYTAKNANYPIKDKSLEKEIPKGVKILKQPICEPNNIAYLFKNKKTESAGFLNATPTFLGKIVQYIRANYFIPDARKYWVQPSVNYLKKYILKNNIEVIITTGPPHSVHLIGLKLKQQLNVKWIADFRDPWTEIDYFHQLPLSKKAIKKHHKLEQKVLKNANKVLVVGNTMKANYAKFTNQVVTITNGFDGKLVKENTQQHPKFLITHIGLINADRNPKILWSVLAEIVSENKEFANDFVLKLIGNVDKTIIKSISENKLEKKVQLINYVTHNKVIEFQKQAQVLLLLVNNVPSAKGIITGKIFEYLMVKRPILAIAPSNGDLAEILTNTKAGVVIDFENSIALKSKILELYANYKKGTLNVQSINIKQYHRKELTKQVAKIIYKITE